MVYRINYSGDKKANLNALSGIRGRKVISEAIIPKDVVNKVLKSSPQSMVSYFQASTLSSIQKASLGNHGHVANGLTAIYIACGQDVACVSESAVGILRMELTGNGDLYAALSLPS